jgi:hypothetical protein
MEILCSISVYGIKKGGDIINRQLIYELLDPCLDDQASLARVFNAAPGLSSIDIYVNDISRIRNIEYKEITSYIPTRPGPRNTKVYQSQSNNLLLEVPDIVVPPSQILTVAVFGSSNNLKYMPIIDDINVNVAPDQTKIRFYNLDASDVAFTITSPIGSTSISLASGTGNEYTQINPGEYKLQIRSTATINITLNLKPGRIYTLYIIGSVSPDSPSYAQANIPQVVVTVDGNTLFDKCIW